MSEYVTLRERIDELIRKHGTLRAAARVLMTDCGYLHRLRNGEKTEPGDPLLRRMGLREVRCYERAATPHPPQGRGAAGEGGERGEGVAMGDCGNAECNWRGPLSECSHIGAVGPCCPECREIVEPDAAGLRGDEAQITPQNRHAEAGTDGLESLVPVPDEDPARAERGYVRMVPDGTAAAEPFTCRGLSSFCAEVGHKCRAAGKCVYTQEVEPLPEDDDAAEWEHPCPFRGEPTKTPAGEACSACGLRESHINDTAAAAPSAAAQSTKGTGN